MSKKFYTDTDIEELFDSGVKTLRVDDEIVLTDLAFEKARKLGLIVDSESPPAAPVRPYLSEAKTIQRMGKIDSVSSASSQPTQSLTPDPSPREALPQGAKAERESVLEKRIREKVAAKLGNQVEQQLLDEIIRRTLKVTGRK